MGAQREGSPLLCPPPCGAPGAEGRLGTFGGSTQPPHGWLEANANTAALSPPPPRAPHAGNDRPLCSYPGGRTAPKAGKGGGKKKNPDHGGLLFLPVFLQEECRAVRPARTRWGREKFGIKSSERRWSGEGAAWLASCRHCA